MDGRQLLVRLLHTSDWHLGRLLRSVPLVEHQRAFLDWLAELAEERQVDAILVSGDVYDRAIPSVEAIAALEEALGRLRSVCPVILISGNHDSIVRLGFAHELLEYAGIHLRTGVEGIDRPVELTDGDQTVLVYGIPYLEPELVRTRWDADKTHEAVLTAAMDAVRADLGSRLTQIPEGAAAPRSVVLAHAFVLGGHPSDSERDVSVGTLGYAPAGVFSGVDYVALGHLHGPQAIEAPGAPAMRYSGSPMAYSFSEEAHAKSVVLVEIPATGSVEVELVPTPVPRRLVTITGTIDDLLADPGLSDAAEAWVRAVVTDTHRPEHAMERLRARFPHTIEMSWQPPSAGLPITPPTPGAGSPGFDPVPLVSAFIHHVTGEPATPRELELVQESVERVRISEAQA